MFYPLYVDYDHSLSLAMFPSPFIPFTVIIDPNGVVTAIHSGLGTYEDFQGYVDEALANAPAEEAPGGDGSRRGRRVRRAYTGGHAKNRAARRGSPVFCM